MHPRLRALLAALCLALAGSAGAAVPAVKKPAPLSKAGYEAAKANIDRQYQADRKLCGSLDGHRQDVCEAEAKGKAQATRAELEALYQPSPDAEQNAKEVTAEANFRVAKVKCKAQKGDARDRCMDLAKAAREAAIRQAKVEKIQETGGPFRKGAAARRGFAGAS